MIFAVGAPHAFHIWTTATMFFVTTCMSLPAHNLKGQLLFEWFLTLVCSGSILSASSFFRNENQRQKAMLWQHSPAMPGSYLFLFCCLAAICLAQIEERLKGKPSFGGRAAGFYTSNFICSKHVAATSPPGHRKD